ncbi:MAG: hypothetical protein RIS47_1087 [Bacteroidota bacterium]|jgi:hypothetical protein
MRPDEFVKRASLALEKLPYVKDLSFVTRGYVVKGAAVLGFDVRLKILYHGISLKLNFALIGNEGRIWAIDRHQPFDWHRHPLNDTATHEVIDTLEIEEIVAELDRVISDIQANSPSIDRN